MATTDSTLRDARLELLKPCRTLDYCDCLKKRSSPSFNAYRMDTDSNQLADLCHTLAHSERSSAFFQVISWSHLSASGPVAIKWSFSPASPSLETLVPCRTKCLADAPPPSQGRISSLRWTVMVVRLAPINPNLRLLPISHSRRKRVLISKYMLSKLLCLCH